MTVEEREALTSGSAGHLFQKLAVETRVDGTFVATAARVDAFEQTLAEDRTKSVASDSMKFNETKHLFLSEAEKLSTADIVHRKLLDQMPYSCVTAQEPRLMGNLQKEAQKTKREFDT